MAYDGMAAYGQGLLNRGTAPTTSRSSAAAAAITAPRPQAAANKGWFGDAIGSVSGGEWLGAGLSILGGFMGDRSSRRSSRDDRRFQREQAELLRQENAATRSQQRELGLQGLRAGMQGDQDQYSREIMRNRGAIAPWGQMYNGPRFTNANPNAPIYNPLMEEGHMFSQLDPINAPRVPAPAPVVKPEDTQVKPAPRRRRRK